MAIVKSYTEIRHSYWEFRDSAEAEEVYKEIPETVFAASVRHKKIAGIQLQPERTFLMHMQ